MEFKKNISAFNLFVSSIALEALGFYIFFNTDIFLEWFPMIVGTILIYTSLSKFYSFYNKKNNKNNFVLLGDFVILIQGILAFIKPNLILIIFPAFVVFYSLCLGTISAIVFYQYKKAKAPFSILMILKSIAFFVIAFLVITANFYDKTFIITKLTGLYLIFYGITIFTDFIDEEIPKSYANKLIRKFSVRLPVLFTTNILKNTLKKVNDFINQVDTNNGEINLSENQIGLEPNLDILIHVKKDGTGAFGHVDFFFDGYVISYGNYDFSSLKLFGSMGEGVLFFANSKENYIKFCNWYDEKTIFDFGLRLTDLQIEKVRNKIKEHMANSYYWLAPIDYYNNKNKDYDDYASELSKANNITFRKIKRGRFKYYFTFYTNCVKFADSILGQAGIDILNLNGVISPGAYFNYFDREYRRKNSIVITKTVYNPKGIVK
ncbi:DUF308 domain-containing protein [Anaerofustis stercorihominis]|uniref:DUF308 domain-containing protein n=1 Tax=Anaerofustis stercorihominis TaxID=214853 RepID=UPI00214C8612|nr:DUF308 domain-containing protein [Anaerofustis stercorihominis]MCR2032966.1 DUF308 domain-containing protein [Anaerofustis stercorihominis]